MANADPNGRIFTPEQLWNIDSKLDDGKPATGRLVVRSDNGLSSCTNTVSNNSATMTADYLLTSSAVTCVAIFIQPF